MNAAVEASTVHGAPAAGGRTPLVHWCGPGVGTIQGPCLMPVLTTGSVQQCACHGPYCQNRCCRRRCCCCSCWRGHQNMSGAYHMTAWPAVRQAFQTMTTPCGSCLSTFQASPKCGLVHRGCAEPNLQAGHNTGCGEHSSNCTNKPPWQQLH